MKRILAGVNSAGRSCVVEETALSAAGDQVLFEDANVADRSRPAGSARTVNLGLGAGCVRWFRGVMGADQRVPMHHTDTVDLALITEGWVELLLDDGAHRLAAGDHAVVTGVDHGWQAGPEGCVMTALLFGTEPHQ